VLDDLAGRGWDVSRVGVLGVSYGASVALLAAGRDPRIVTVVAMEPFFGRESRAGTHARGIHRRGKGISDRQFAKAHVREAEIAGFDWADADIPAALAHARPVLFIHGEKDTWLSAEHSRELAKIAPPGSQLTLAPLGNHVSLPLQLETFAPAVVEWFERACDDRDDITQPRARGRDVRVRPAQSRPQGRNECGPAIQS
jgi:pimeloyl-ACP methyl ester carboxylesterase